MLPNILYVVFLAGNTFIWKPHVFSYIFGRKHFYLKTIIFFFEKIISIFLNFSDRNISENSRIYNYLKMFIKLGESTRLKQTYQSITFNQLNLKKKTQSIIIYVYPEVVKFSETWGLLYIPNNQNTIKTSVITEISKNRNVHQYQKKKIKKYKTISI